MAAIENASRVLDALADSEEPLTFSRLVAVSKLPKSSLHNVCTRLVRARLIERTAEGTYQIGLRLVELSRHRLVSTKMVSRFEQVCAANPPGRDESIMLSVLDGADALYLGCRHGERLAAIRYHVGMRLPAAFTATGKALLAMQPPRHLRKRVQAEFKSRDSGVCKSRNQLLRELEAIRRNGYAIDDEEATPGMLCFGAPIRGAGESSAAGAVGVSVHKADADLDRRVALVTRVKLLAAAVDTEVATP